MTGQRQAARADHRRATTPYAAASAAAARGRLRPATVVALTRAQRRFVEMRGRQILWRAANQLGKSHALAYKIIALVEAIGVYAHRTPGPKRILVVSESKEQMEPLHRKLWELLPKDRIDLETTEYIPGFGFRGKPPRITWISGPGAGSVIVFATYAQGSKRIAGGTYDVVAADEPLPEKIYGECLMRCMHGDPGELWITLTVTPESPPMGYLRKKVEKRDENGRPEIQELHTPLTVEAMRLETGTSCLWKGRRTPADEVARNIEEFSSLQLAVERDMRINGGWEIVVQDRMLDNWGPDCVRTINPWPGAWLCIGIDHGTGLGRQTVALVQLDLSNRQFPRVGVLELWRGQGMTRPENDAAAIHGMLRDRGLSWRDVDAWWGDRATSANKAGVRKENKQLHTFLALQAGVPADEFPRLNVPSKDGSTVMYGYQLMNACMGRREELPGDVRGKGTGLPHFLVDPKCTEFIEAARRHNGRNPKDPLKDALDCVRYPVEKEIKPERFAGMALLG